MNSLHPGFSLWLQALSPFAILDWLHIFKSQCRNLPQMVYSSTIKLSHQPTCQIGANFLSFCSYTRKLKALKALKVASHFSANGVQQGTAIPGTNKYNTEGYVGIRSGLLH